MAIPQFTEAQKQELRDLTREWAGMVSDTLGIPVNEQSADAVFDQAFNEVFGNEEESDIQAEIMLVTEGGTEMPLGEWASRVEQKLHDNHRATVEGADLLYQLAVLSGDLAKKVEEEVLPFIEEQKRRVAGPGRNIVDDGEDLATKLDQMAWFARADAKEAISTTVRQFYSGRAEALGEVARMIREGEY